MLPTTTQRVTDHTPDQINERIRLRTEESVARCTLAGPEAIEQRLAELEREWDIERVLEANAASIALFGLGMGAFADRRYFALPPIVMGFLLQHALQGWCPPVPYCGGSASAHRAKSTRNDTRSRRCAATSKRSRR
ncbi:MAG: hypothetical protein K0R53_433 [Burkholderiales bacterium]|nr:hypothetical protein [Burkholderiales bacterium]